ncbi:related to alpha/beta superfamily hydrolase [Ramularia collo-cygni]|uniref:Related to alpha/beta superfamily hydrolase n=1 Tax=Ramularia collo-cygni TaxID=112498 RepID=A0A2D3VGY4_9PEZI|nr:related to alpha/beta superfamily hydrolase [Ramularia collo-cygni]CZT25295.1 related to alpha/beta superfamily hydrolase [Ramularia collo-cygni]
MPYIGRSENMYDYATACRPVEWQETHIKSLDGTDIALCVGSLSPKASRPSRHLVICYFQGNGSSPPPRLPMLSNVLKSIETQMPTSNVHFTIVALAYRGYWTSSGRSSQPGIEKDAQALLRWVNNTYDDPNVQLGLILWGQSIGAGVASTAAAEYIRDSNLPCKAPISGLILETPFSSIKSMLIALYPQRWLPYRYLWPFLWNFWDSELALRKIAEAEHQFKVFLMSATRDEVVPPGEADKLERLCKELGLEMERKDIIGALHTEASTRREGQNAIARFAIEVASGGKGDERFVHGRDSYGLHRRKMM